LQTWAIPHEFAGYSVVFEDEVIWDVAALAGSRIAATCKLIDI
jgi:hypothetical protein